MVDTQISNALSGNKHADSELRGATQESWRRADSQGTLADVELGGPGRGGKANSQTRSSASPNVINVLYAGPSPMLPMNGLSGANVGAGCDCHPAQRPCSPRMF